MNHDKGREKKGHFSPYKGPAGGWGALKSSVKHLIRSENALTGIKTLLRTNQPTGFDCPGCAWGEAPEAGRVDFCENGVKAVAWEATSKRVTREFFATHPVSELLKQDNHFLESQGRLTEPMRYDPADDCYHPISWDEAFALIGRTLRELDSPDEALFYTSGRASNEAAFLYQLFGRVYGTNNFPDCSNMCHEPSGTALGASLGTGKGTVTMADFDQADAIFVFGQNPGTNHPRMLNTLRDAAKRGATIVAVNPLKERGLQNFQHPQKPSEMLIGSSTTLAQHYFTPRLGGDMALLRGMAKCLWERHKQGEPCLDTAFIDEHTAGFDAYTAALDATPWPALTAQSGLTQQQIEQLAELYAAAERCIFTWAMGITQHKHAVATVQELVNVLLLRGNIGRPGAGACPVRGHSNVQGNRTVGITEHPAPEFLGALGEHFNFDPPRRSGVNTVQAIQAMLDGRAKVFIALGGNFAAATPDTAKTETALWRCELIVNISTKLNRSHLVTGQQALILPCLGRTEIDRQSGGEQCVTVEDSMSMVHASAGRNEPASSDLKSETAIVAGIAAATLGTGTIDWSAYCADYGRIRDAIAAVLPSFADYNNRIRRPGGFYLGNSAAERRWQTASGKAEFRANVLPVHLPGNTLETVAGKPVFTLQTLRSHDQYNTTIYGMDDRYRGIHGMRNVLFMNPVDIREHGFSDGQTVTITSLWEDGAKRSVSDFTIVAYDTPRGCLAAYYPETNPLVPLESVADGCGTPTSKAIRVVLH